MFKQVLPMDVVDMFKQVLDRECHVMTTIAYR